jgi:hypothetical protein
VLLLDAVAPLLVAVVLLGLACLVVLLPARQPALRHLCTQVCLQLPVHLSLRAVLHVLPRLSSECLPLPLPLLAVLCADQPVVHLPVQLPLPAELPAALCR